MGNLPVLVKPGRIVPQLVNQHSFSSPYNLNKHKTRESYAGLPLLEEQVGIGACMCPPSHACALTEKRRFRTRIRGNLPVLVKPGRIVPQLVNQHGFTSPYDLNKHKTRESYAGLPLLEERLGGYTIRVCIEIRVSPEEDHENIGIRRELACVPSICV